MMDLVELLVMVPNLKVLILLHIVNYMFRRSFLMDLYTYSTVQVLLYHLSIQIIALPNKHFLLILAQLILLDILILEEVMALEKVLQVILMIHLILHKYILHKYLCI